MAAAERRRPTFWNFNLGHFLSILATVGSIAFAAGVLQAKLEAHASNTAIHGKLEPEVLRKIAVEAMAERERTTDAKIQAVVDRLGDLRDAVNSLQTTIQRQRMEDQRQRFEDWKDREHGPR